MLHTSLLLLVPRTEVLVRFEVLNPSGGAGGCELSHTLIHPLTSPSQSAEIHLLDGIDEIGGLLLDLLVENLLRVEVDSYAFSVMLQMQPGNRAGQLDPCGWPWSLWPRWIWRH